MNTLKKNVELKSQSVCLRCSEKHQSDQCPLKTIENQVPLRNWTGFCADATNSIMGCHNSVAKLISDNYPWVVVVKCGCHSIHLCASYACKKLTKTLEDFCSHVYSHFSMSAKRVAVLKEFQDFSATPDHKILAPGQTRWLCVWRTNPCMCEESLNSGAHCPSISLVPILMTPLIATNLPLVLWKILLWRF